MKNIIVNPSIDVKELPFIGKTFSLYGDDLNSDGFYEEIKGIVDLLLQYYKDEKELLKFIDEIGISKHKTRKLKKSKDGEIISLILNSSKYLSKYTRPVESHLQNLTLSERFNKTISTTEEQYHLKMIEIELVNRIFIDKFKKAEIKMAFLPHCLHDLDKDCLSETDGIDYVCKKCSKKCFINAVTRLLESFDVKAYIWMSANLKSLFKKLKSANKSVGVLGVACIPELVNGMRMCMKYDIPVVGVPLDANRCRRWMGEFHKTSVNLSKLESLLKN